VRLYGATDVAYCTVPRHILDGIFQRTLNQMSIHLAAACVGLALMVPSVSARQDLDVSMRRGRVTIRAQQVSIKAILDEWGRVAHTTIVHADDLADQIVTLALVDVPEARALRTLLRNAAGYLAALRTSRSDGASQFDRILVMADSKPTVPQSASALPGTKPQPPRVNPAANASSPPGSTDGRRGRTPFTATAAQQEQLQQLQQLLQSDGDDDVEADAGAPATTFGSVPTSRPGLPMRSADPSQEAAGIQTGAFGTTAPAQPAREARPTNTRRR